MSPRCEGGQRERIAGDPTGPLNLALAELLSRPLACNACATHLLMEGRA